MDSRVHHLLDILYAGGNFAYFWNRHKTSWFDANDQKDREEALSLFDLSTENIHMPVNPVIKIPSTTALGRPADPIYVRGRLEHVQTVNVLFAEFDAKDYTRGLGQAAAHIRGLALQPTIAVMSGFGYHCYWRLQPHGANIKQLKDTQTRWVKFVKADAGAKDLARVLRLPEVSFNHKYTPPRQVEIKLWELDRIYSLEQVVDLMPRPEPRPIVLPRLHSGNTSRFVQVAMDKEASRVQQATHGNRHISLMQAAWSLGQLVGGGILSYQAAASALLIAAQSAGMYESEGQNEVERCVVAGLNDGMNSPRTEARNNSSPGRDILGQILDQRRQASERTA